MMTPYTGGYYGSNIGTSFWWNVATQKYDIMVTQGLNGSSTLYYDPAKPGITYDLARHIRAFGALSVTIMRRSCMIALLHTAGGTKSYYDPTTGTYHLNSQYAYSTIYYDPSTGLFDTSSPYVVTGNYALASNLDASGSTYVTSLVQDFSGTFAGLGHTISNLTLNSPSIPSA